MAHKVQIKEESILMTRDNGEIFLCHFRKVFSLSSPTAGKTNRYLWSFYVADINVSATICCSVGAFSNTSFNFSRYLFSSMTCLMMMSGAKTRPI